MTGLVAMAALLHKMCCAPGVVGHVIHLNYDCHTVSVSPELVSQWFLPAAAAAAVVLPQVGVDEKLASVI